LAGIVGAGGAACVARATGRPGLPAPAAGAVATNAASATATDVPSILRAVRPCRLEASERRDLDNSFTLTLPWCA